MSGLFGGAPQRLATQQPQVLSAIPIQTSLLALVIPLVYGTNRTAGNLIWYGNFHAVPQAEAGGKGGTGKGGLFGGGGSGGITWIYYAAVMIGLCEGPVTGIAGIWQNKEEILASRNANVSETLQVPDAGAYEVTISQSQYFVGTVGVSTWGVTGGDGWGGNLYGWVAMSETGYPPGPGQYTDNGNGTYSFNSAQAGASVLVTYTYEQSALNFVGFDFYDGSYSQAPWPYVAGYAPGDAIAYRGTAYVAAENLQLEADGSMPQYNYEIEGLLSYANNGANGAQGSGAADANPADIVIDFLTDPNHGAGYPVAALGDLSNYRAYCAAAGLLASPVYDSQTEAATALSDLVRSTNADFVWSGASLTIVPYGDTAIGAWTPNLTPLYDLTDDDFLHKQGDDPVRLTRSSPADAYNVAQVEFTDRVNAYSPGIAEWKDQGAIDLYGPRPAQPLSARWFTSSTPAQQAAQLIGQRQLYVRNSFAFTLPATFFCLDPLDLVTITDAGLGLSRQLVRITEIEEDDKGNLRVTAEEVPIGAAAAAEYGVQARAGYKTDYNVDPGDVNAPVIFEAPVEIAASGLETWIGASGGPDWGGANVWVSSDNATYRQIATIASPARQGVLAQNLPAGADPDTSDTLAVDLSESAGTLLSGTQSDADLYHTLCYVDGELISYQTATLTAANTYNLSYLRRGAYGTAIASHAAGAPFCRLDGAILKLPYSKDKIGTVLYVKFQSFNIWGTGLQSLADCAVYPHVLQGPPAPGNVTGFTVGQNGDVVVFAWDDLADFALKGYDIRYGTPGTAWGSMTPLTEAAKGTEMTNAAVPPGTWTFAIRGRDIADQLSPTAATQTLTVSLANPTLSTEQAAPDWRNVYADLGSVAQGGPIPFDFGAVNVAPAFISDLRSLS